MINKYKRSVFFDMSDDFFYRISLIGFLIIFSSMIFFLTKYREKKYEAGIKYNDKDLNIKWPVKKPVISKKDVHNLSFKEFKKLKIR